MDSNDDIPFTNKIDSNHTIYHVQNAETANPVNWYLISGEGDCGDGDCGEGDCGEGEWIPSEHQTVVNKLFDLPLFGKDELQNQNLAPFLILCHSEI